MNERIQKLWEEAAKTTQGDSWEEQTKFIEKFAQLIVAECGDWIINNAGAMEHLGPDYFAKAMTKDFGVEL